MFDLYGTPEAPRSAGTLAGAPFISDENRVHVKIVGHQWWWEFEYPEFKFTTANELHLPANAIVSVDLESVDVIHSFWVPQLGGKTDAIPGRTNQMWFQAGQIGTFHGQCAEFCGIQHADMRFSVVVEPEDQFRAWVERQQAQVAAKSGAAAQGEQVFMTGACIGCHTIDGTKAVGKVGPNLTHFASRDTFAGGSMANNTENLRRWLQNPEREKPGNMMKIVPLAPDQIEALIAYLQSLE
jgi:cytochrome c oxidase subunit 2